MLPAGRLPYRECPQGSEQMEHELEFPGTFGLGTRTFLAAVLAPTIVPPVALFSLLFSFDDPVGSLQALAEITLALFSFVGLWAYGFGLVACIAMGLPLTLAARYFEVLRPIWVWLTIGAVGGAAIAGAYSVHFMVAGVVTGSTTALLFRLIVGQRLED